MLKRNDCLQNRVGCRFPFLDVLSCFSCVLACMNLDSFNVSKALGWCCEHVLECVDESGRRESSRSKHGISGIGILEIIWTRYVIDDEIYVCQVLDEARTDGPLLAVLAPS